MPNVAPAKSSGAGRMSTDPALVIACGALAKEITTLIAINQWHQLRVQCIPAKIHNYPEQIPDAVRQIIHKARPDYKNIFVAFADCGTGGLLDTVIKEENIERLEGAHCYEFYAGSETFTKLTEQEPGTFYLTDFLAKHFDRLIITELGISKHPELRDMYFSNYKKLVYLAQTDNPDLANKAKDAARYLNLQYEFKRTNYGGLERGLEKFNESIVQWQN